MACIVRLPNLDAKLARLAVALILENMDCEPSAAPGDLVRIDTTTINKVLVAEDNLVSNPVIGVIKDKTSATKCNVYLRGIIDRVVGQGKLYLSATGDFTTTPPVSDYRQVLGYSFGNGKINLEPNQLVTLIT